MLYESRVALEAHGSLADATVEDSYIPADDVMAAAIVAAPITWLPRPRFACAAVYDAADAGGPHAILFRARAKRLLQTLRLPAAIFVAVIVAAGLPLRVTVFAQARAFTRLTEAQHVPELVSAHLADRLAAAIALTVVTSLFVVLMLSAGEASTRAHALSTQHMC